MHPRFNRFYSPDDAPGVGTSNQADGASDETETFELLNVEDEPEVIDLKGVKEKSEDGPDDDDEKDEEEDELKEIEEELAGPKDEDLELTTPVRRKEILAKYPR